MTYRVKVDGELCISSGKCVADFPAAFRFDADEVAEPTEGVRDLGDDEVIAAARNCPASAILVFDAEDHEVDIWA
jgi:ferredoxin